MAGLAALMQGGGGAPGAAPGGGGGPAPGGGGAVPGGGGGAPTGGGIRGLLQRGQKSVAKGTRGLQQFVFGGKMPTDMGPGGGGGEGAAMAELDALEQRAQELELTQAGEATARTEQAYPLPEEQMVPGAGGQGPRKAPGLRGLMGGGR